MPHENGREKRRKTLTAGLMVDFAFSASFGGFLWFSVSSFFSFYFATTRRCRKLIRWREENRGTAAQREKRDNRARRGKRAERNDTPTSNNLLLPSNDTSSPYTHLCSLALTLTRPFRLTRLPLLPSPILFYPRHHS